MNPNTFLKTFWQMELKPQVFVAMTFEADYQSRYDEVIAPAIRSLVNKTPLEPYRVDTSQSGDCILTKISDGIAHSQLVLADVSSVGKDSKTGHPYRNGNVMYEVGLALACRQPSDVLLIRDDHDDFLFDVSTVPHLTIDFTDTNAARQKLLEELSKRLKEQQFVNDARVQIAFASLSGEEVILLKQMKELGPNGVLGTTVKKITNWYSTATCRLLDKQLIRTVGEFQENEPVFIFTRLGYVVKQMVNSELRKFESDQEPQLKEEAKEHKGSGNDSQGDASGIDPLPEFENEQQ